MPGAEHNENPSLPLKIGNLSINERRQMNAASRRYLYGQQYFHSKRVAEVNKLTHSPQQTVAVPLVVTTYHFLGLSSDYS